MHLLELPPELLLSIASSLSQADLLNVSMTHSRLRKVTEPELFREYSNTRVDGRSFKPFISRLIDRPELAKYVQKVDLRAYTHVGDLDPDRSIDLSGLPQCTEHEYKLLTEAALSAGVITTILPYEPVSSILRNLELGLAMERGDRWYEFLYNNYVHIDYVIYDAQFCKLLRIGIDEPLVILLLALLHNLRSLDIYGTPHFLHSLEWRNAHGFKSLEHFTACATDNQMEWPLGFFSELLRGGSLKTLEVFLAGDGWREGDFGFGATDGIFIPFPLSFVPRSTQITHLTLQNCTLTKTYMEKLLQACAPLHTLYYSTGGRYVAPKNFNTSELIALLEPHRKSLRNLHLDMSKTWDFDEDLEPLPSLRAFTQLRKLDTTMLTLSDIFLGPDDDDAWEAFETRLEKCVPLDGTAEKLRDRLPLSIEHLVLHCPDYPARGEWDYRQLTDVVSQGRELLPNLKLIEVVDCGRDWSVNLYPRLKQLLSQISARNQEESIYFDFLTQERYLTINHTVFLKEDGRRRRSKPALTWENDKYAIQNESLVGRKRRLLLDLDEETSSDSSDEETSSDSDSDGDDMDDTSMRSDSE